MAAAPPELETFWIPVAQIVPVFALALVLEARRLAGRWRAQQRGARFTQAVVVAVAGFLLWAVGTIAIVSMATRSASRWALIPAVVALCLVLAGMGLAPVLDIAARGYADVWAILTALLPGSQWRKSRAFVRNSRQLVNDYFASCHQVEEAQRAQLDTLDRLEPQFASYEPDTLIRLPSEAAQAFLDEDESANHPDAGATSTFSAARLHDAARRNRERLVTELEKSARDISRATGMIENLDKLENLNRLSNVWVGSIAEMNKRLGPFRDAITMQEGDAMLDTLRREVDETSRLLRDAANGNG